MQFLVRTLILLIIMHFYGVSLTVRFLLVFCCPKKAIVTLIKGPSNFTMAQYKKENFEETLSLRILSVWQVIPLLLIDGMRSEAVYSILI